MKYFSILIILFISTDAFSQGCSNEILLQTPGTLKADAAYNSGKLSTVDLAKHKKVLATISSMIKSGYAPIAVKALFHESYGYPAANRPVIDYGYSIIPLNFYCDGNTIKIAGETPTHFKIIANMCSAEIYEPFNNNKTTSGTGFHYIPDMPVEKDGNWYFKEIETTLVLGKPGSGKEYQWLITYNGKLPFAYVNKKEFLEVQKKIVASAMFMAASGFTDVLKNKEIEKAFKEKEYKNEPEKLNKYMKMDYLESKARYEKLLSDNEKDYQPAMERIVTQLKMPEAELNQQAIVKLDSRGSHSAYLFTDDNDPFGQVLIKPNPAYFKKLPKSTPQFFWIYLRGSHKDPIAAKFMKDIMGAVDFTILKNMVGK